MKIIKLLIILTISLTILSSFTLINSQLTEQEVPNTDYIEGLTQLSSSLTNDDFNTNMPGFLQVGDKDTNVNGRSNFNINPDEKKHKMKKKISKYDGPGYINMDNYFVNKDKKQDYFRFAQKHDVLEGEGPPGQGDAYQGGTAQSMFEPGSKTDGENSMPLHMDQVNKNFLHNGILLKLDSDGNGQRTVNTGTNSEAWELIKEADMG